MLRIISWFVILLAVASTGSLLIIVHHFGPILPIAIVVGYGATFGTYINAYIAPEVEDIAMMLAGFIPSGVYILLALLFPASYSQETGHLHHPWSDTIVQGLFPSLVIVFIGLCAMVYTQEDRRILASLTAVAQLVCALGAFVISAMAISGSWI